MITLGADEKGPDAVVAWLKAELELKSQRQLGRELGIDPSIISRNMKRLRKGKGMAAPFRKKVGGIIERGRADKLHRQHLEEQEEVAELDRQEAIEREKEGELEAEQQAEAEAAQREAGRKTKAAKAKREAEEAQRQRELEDDFIRSVEGWEDKFRAAGYMAEGEMVEGDAEELLLAGISDLNYVDIGVAAVALLPDDYVIWRDKTVAFFREGVPYTQRLKPTAVRNGQPRPAMIGNLPASVVYYDPLPDQRWRCGKAGAKVVAEWHHLTDTYGHLATGKLPRVVHPETVAAFERLIHIEEHSGYTFEDSRLGPDARDRLKALQRRAILPAIVITATDITWDASKVTARWFCSVGWKWLAIAVAALVAIAVGVGVAWGMWEALKWWWGVFTNWWTWSKANGEVLLLGGVILAGIGEAVWWVWPKRGDTGGKVFLRVGVVMLVVLFVGIVVTGAIIAAPAFKEIAAAIDSYDLYNQTIVIP